MFPLALAAFIPTLAIVAPAAAQNAQAVFSRVSASVVSVRTTSGQGSGVAVARKAQGFGQATTIVTNCHVVKGESVVMVTHKQVTGMGVVTSCDEIRDLALINVAGEIPVVPTRPARSLEVGEAVFAVGSPRGLELSITNGIVSALRRASDGAAPQIQTTAPISPGSSGGGLFDTQGRLVGITTLFLKDSQALNCAIPSEWIAHAEVRGNVSAEGTKAKPKDVPAPRPAPTQPQARGYTKIANNGQALLASAPLGDGEAEWACTRDDRTGLIWEVKTARGLRDNKHRYSWRDRDATNGNPATEGRGECHQSGRCDTEKFVADVNAARLCGARDWRLPLVDELKGLIDQSQQPTINSIFFPHTFMDFYWSGSPVASTPGYAWGVYFSYGSSYANGGNYGTGQVRLVRVGR